MNQKILMSACLLAIAATSGATEPPKQNFECDTLAGHFSYWNRKPASIEFLCSTGDFEFRNFVIQE